MKNRKISIADLYIFQIVKNKADENHPDCPYRSFIEIGTEQNFVEAK